MLHNRICASFHQASVKTFIEINRKQLALRKVSVQDDQVRSRLFYKIVNANETWCFQYDSETRKSSGRLQTNQIPKKSRLEKSEVWTMFIYFDDSKSIVHKKIFHLANPLMHCSVVRFRSVWLMVIVVFLQNIAKKEDGICCMIMCYLLDQYL